MAMTLAADITGRLAIDADDYLGETPVWSTTEQALYWVNCEEPPRLRRWVPGSSEIQSWPMPDRLGGMALRRDGDPIVCAGPAVYNLDKATGALSLIARSPFPDHVKLHESCVDRRGRLWVGVFDMRLSPQNFHPCGGALFRLDGDRLIPMVPNLSVANALAFSPDGKVMYFTNATTGVIWAADIDPASGAILGMREFLRMAEGEIGDGATVDAEGGYWLAMVSHGEVRRYRPDGTLDRTLKTPCSQPTKPAFGGKDLRTMYVTSTKLDIKGMINIPEVDAPEPNGGIYELDAGVPGLAEPFFEG
jgi:sugar lactone lactonase YvrE